MITSIIAENSTEYIRRHITQENKNKGFRKVYVCIREDGGDIEDIERINSLQNLYRSRNENKIRVLSAHLGLNRVLLAHLGSTEYYQPT